MSLPFASVVLSLAAAFAVTLPAALAQEPAAAPTMEDAAPLSAAEVKSRWHRRLDGRHFSASVRLTMTIGDQREHRELHVFRDDGDDRHERVMVRFHEPSDLRNTAFLYLERAGLPNDYFMYQPGTRRVRRLPEAVVSKDFYGLDLEFLGFGVSEVQPTEIVEMRGEELLGRPVYRLHERAAGPDARFDERITWIDAVSFVPVRTEHHLKGKRELRADTVEVAERQGVATPVRMVFERGDRRTFELVIDEVDYEAVIPEEYFSVMALVKSRSR